MCPPRLQECGLFFIFVSPAAETMPVNLYRTGLVQIPLTWNLGCVYQAILSIPWEDNIWKLGSVLSSLLIALSTQQAESTALPIVVINGLSWVHGFVVSRVLWVSCIWQVCNKYLGVKVVTESSGYDDDNQSLHLFLNFCEPFGISSVWFCSPFQEFGIHCPQKPFGNLSRRANPLSKSLQ